MTFWCRILLNKLWEGERGSVLGQASNYHRERARRSDQLRGIRTAVVSMSFYSVLAVCARVCALCCIETPGHDRKAQESKEKKLNDEPERQEMMHDVAGRLQFVLLAKILRAQL